MAKTTIELPDPLLRDAKRIAQERGITLRALVEAGLRAELARRPPSFSLTLRTAGRADDPVPDRPPHEYAYDDG